MAGTGTLKAKKRKLAIALAEGLTVKAAAERAGIAERTAFRYLKDDPRIHAEVDRILGESTEAAKRKLRAYATRAVETLIQVSDEGGREQSHRVSAARAILDRAGIPAGQKIDLHVSGGLVELTDDELDKEIAKVDREIDGTIEDEGDE